MSYELDKYVIDKELQQTDDFIFCVARFLLPFVLCLANKLIRDQELLTCIF